MQSWLHLPKNSTEYLFMVVNIKTIRTVQNIAIFILSFLKYINLSCQALRYICSVSVKKSMFYAYLAQVVSTIPPRCQNCL